MRITLPTIAFLLLSPTALSAQTLTENFIELTVSDTVPVRVSGISYQITPQDPDADKVNYDENTDYDRMMREQSERMQKVVDKLKKELQGQRFTVTDATPAYGDPYTVSSYTDNTTINSTVQVALKDEAELKRLVTWLRQRGGVDGSVLRWDYAQSEVARSVMQALYERAHAQAQQLAELGGRKLGKLLSAQDPQQRQMTFQDFIGAIADREHGGNDAEAMARLRLRSMVFRFALVD